MYINIINVSETVVICFVFNTIKFVHVFVVIILRVQTSVLP